MDILRTHPMVIIGGILQENPFFVPPDEFLRELRERAGQNSPLTLPSPPAAGREGVKIAPSPPSAGERVG